MDFTCCAAAVAAMIERLIQIDKASLQFLKSPKKNSEFKTVFNCKYTKEPGMSPQLANFKAFRTKQI